MSQGSSNGNGSDPERPPRARAWLSRGLPALFDGRPADDGPPHFDVVIVGSGYGGAVAAASLAGSRSRRSSQPLRIALLERGEEYLPGSFPSQLSELPGHVRFSLDKATEPRGVRTGLFDVRVGPDVVTLLANGLGGGSLINAGVMLQPRLSVLTEPGWPREIRDAPDALTPFYQRVAEWLGAGWADAANTVTRAGGVPDKLQALEHLLGTPATRIPVTIAFGPDETSSAGVRMHPCLACGDCATGCNHGAKASLDVNLLVLAAREGVEIYTGATVLGLEPLETSPSGRRWSIVVTHTDTSLRQRQGPPLRIEADTVILAAGTFGSTEILKRSQPALRISSRLGCQFSANGDLFAAIYDAGRTANAVADECVPPAERRIGPTITGAIADWPGRCNDPATAPGDISVQELAVPGLLRRLFEEAFTTARTLHSMDRPDRTRHTRGDVDRNAVDHAAFTRILPIALISRDGADGQLVLGDGKTPLQDEEGDGALHVRWPHGSADPRFDAHHRAVAARLAARDISGMLLPNPLWKLVPDDVAEVLGMARGPMLTVHPLGGCPMGDDFGSGVVNHLGQVFSCDSHDPQAVHDGLVVLDGAIVPTSLGVNPALTIAALALRAIETLRDREWNLVPGRGLPDMAGRRPPEPGVVRPVFRTPPVPVQAVPTEVQLIERLSGDAILADGKRHHLQLTLHSDPFRVAGLMSPVAASRRIDYDPGASTLTVLCRTPLPTDDAPRDAPSPCPGDCAEPHVQARARVVKGWLEVLQPAPSRWGWRFLRAGLAWARHRGLRDIFQRFTDPGADAPSVSLGKYVHWVFATATRAGARRTFDYTLRLGNFSGSPGHSPVTVFGESAGRKGAVGEARGCKTLTYTRLPNPWQQMMDLELSGLPGLRTKSTTLTLDLPYLARQGVALLRVVKQHDHVHALVDLASLQLYLLRTLLDGHVWSFRRPDRVPDRRIRRLPGRVKRLPEPTVIQIPVAERRVAGGGPEPVCLRLTRYCPPSPRQGQPPVLLIHGYSASGTTFVHPTLRPGLTGRLVKSGRDVWVLDLRSSAGMPGAVEPWSFEEIGCEDIPVAVDHVTRAVGGPVDVVAHCMGAAMLCMALLRDPRPGQPDDRYVELRERLSASIRHIVLSQVGPFVVLSPSNQARAFVMRYVTELLPMADYRFRPDGTMAEVLLDRLLATLPYPTDDLRLENPKRFWERRPWVRTRRRMDALYGRVFEARNLSRATLEHLDDFFGPFSVETVSQVIHFSRVRAITDKHGRHVFATRDRLDRLRDHRILYICGEKNGLADASTAHLLERELKAAGCAYEKQPFAGFGHQDCLIGKRSGPIFDAIEEFLDRPGLELAASGGIGPPSVAREGVGVTSDAEGRRISVTSPSRGVRQWRDEDSRTHTRIAWATGGGRDVPRAVILMPVHEVGGGEGPRWRPPKDLMDDLKRDPRGVWDRTSLRRELRDRRVAVGPDDLDDPRNPAAPRSTTVENNCGARWNTDHLVVLLVYDDSLGTEDPDADAIAEDGHAAAELQYRREVDQLESFFGRNYEWRLVRRGLVRLPPLWPAPEASPVVVALASCQYPADMTDGPPNDHEGPEPPSSASLLQLSRLMTPAREASPSLLVLAGDQVYVDATAGLFDARSRTDRFRLPYQNLLMSPGAQSVFGLVPVAAMLDDHEVSDNWEPGVGPPGTVSGARHGEMARLVDGGRSAYRRFQRMAGPRPRGPHTLWFDFRHAGIPFFVADTRSERFPRRTVHTWRLAHIMGSEQWAALRAFLGAYHECVAVVVSPAMLLPRVVGLEREPSLALRCDGWDGFPASRNELLAHLCETDSQHVVFLSGDAHTSGVHAVTVRRDGHCARLWSVHSSGLYCPYPFANGSPDNYACPEAFDFDWRGQSYHCEVDAMAWAPGDGFATLALSRSDPARPRVAVQFHRARGNPEPVEIVFPPIGVVPPT